MTIKVEAGRIVLATLPGANICAVKVTNKRQLFANRLVQYGEMPFPNGKPLIEVMRASIFRKMK